MSLEWDVITVEGPILLTIVILMRMGTGKPKCVTQAVIDMMMIGENPRRNGYHMMSTRRRRKKSISKKQELFFLSKVGACARKEIGL